MESLFLLNDKEKLVLSSPKLINSLQFFYVTKRNQSETDYHMAKEDNHKRG